MNKRTLILLVSILLLSVVIYAWLGGFASMEYELVERETITVSGEEFIGRPTQQELEDIFYTYRDKADSLNEFLVVINYPMPDTTANVRQFIGVPVEIEGEMMRKIPTGKFVQVRLEKNLVVSPSPEKVLKEASEFASSRGLILDSVSVEFYSREADPLILFSVKN
jgi:hypothetical protein